ncbi:MAG: NAD(P)/FAD-dependent oxidoreductase [Opitutaceae bacterium]|jgi:predicted Rossmann fold flavoprotein
MAGASQPGRRRILVAGGGAAGFFAAIACAEADPLAEVTLHESTARPLSKVRISGGGRCNVTRACPDPGEFARGYPRGSRELIGPLHRFGPAETVAWFAQRGVELKTEEDGRMFPVTDDSATVTDCLVRSARAAGARLLTGSGVRAVARLPAGADARFLVELAAGAAVGADRVLIATGGTSGSAGLSIASSLGHSVAPPVPSLFTFHVDDARLKGLAGVSAPSAGVSVRGSGLRESGPLLVTHSGLSGPAVLRLSAWGARELHAAGYRFALCVNWAEPRTREQARSELESCRGAHPRRRVSSGNPFGLPARLWERLAAAAGIAPGTTWATVTAEAMRALAGQAAACEFAVEGKSMNKEEFVTCGGVRLDEVDMATMESRICPGLYLAGEVLDIDGITGGYNLQAAWTTGWQAGRAMARP